LRLPKALARQLARRIRAVNAVTVELAGLYDTVHFDAANLDELYDRRMWSVDRLHPSEAGHRLLARAFADLLVKQLGFSDSNIGLLQAIYSFPNIFTVVIGGFIIDRLGLRKVHASGIWEARVGLGIRLVFTLSEGLLRLVRAGAHDDVRRYLKSL